LTGTELFSRGIDGIGHNWKNKGGLYERLSQRSYELSQLEILADATQQLYLSLPSWSAWLDTEWNKRRQKQANKKAGIQKTGN
jgi:hypothetical protein